MDNYAMRFLSFDCVVIYWKCCVDELNWFLWVWVLRCVKLVWGVVCAHDFRSSFCKKFEELGHQYRFIRIWKCDVGSPWENESTNPKSIVFIPILYFHSIPSKPINNSIINTKEIINLKNARWLNSLKKEDIIQYKSCISTKQSETLKILRHYLIFMLNFMSWRS